jgi:hypothetical protein
MNRLKFSVFPKKNSDDDAIVLIQNMRIIQGSPPNLIGNQAGEAAIAARFETLEIFGNTMVSPFQEINFLDLDDETTNTFYTLQPHMPGIHHIH